MLFNTFFIFFFPQLQMGLKPQVQNGLDEAHLGWQMGLLKTRFQTRPQCLTKKKTRVTELFLVRSSLSCHKSTQDISYSFSKNKKIFLVNLWWSLCNKDRSFSFYYLFYVWKIGIYLIFISKVYHVRLFAV